MSLTKVPEPQLQDPFVDPIANELTFSLVLRRIYGAGSALRIDGYNGTMYDTAGGMIVLNALDQTLRNSAGTVTLNWTSQQGFSAGIQSIHWGTRLLTKSTGATFINWELGTINGLVYPLVDGGAGDVVTTDGAGNLTLQPIPAASSHQFPLSNTVYVDKEAATLMAEGKLAYDNPEDAIDAHRVGGAAELLYGPYTATNRPVIVGMSNFTPAAQMTVDVDNLMIGCIAGAREAFEVSASIAGGMFDVTASNVEFFNMRMSNLNTGNAAVSITGGLVVKFTNIDFTSSTGAFVTGKVVSSAGIISSIFKNCKMPVDAPGGGALSWAGQSDFLLEDCEIVFNPAGGNFISLGGAGLSSDSILRRMRFTGSSGGNGGFFNSDGATFEPYIEDLTSECTDGLFFIARASGGTMNPSVSGVSGSLNGGFAINATFSGLFDTGFVGSLEEAKVIQVGANGHALSVASGARVRHCILIGNGTGRAVNGAGATIEANLNTVRNPTGDVAGTWTDATLAPAANQFNAEILAAATS